MKISYNWLKEYVHTDLSAEEVSTLLTACGLEVEAIEKYETVSGGLKGLVIGKVLSCEKHPDADRLSLTKVDVGEEKPLQIVCGAPNVAAGQYVVVATIGTTLYPSQGESFKIKRSKIRGIESEGMICAEDEIGLGTSHAGIIVLPDHPTLGTPAAEYFNIEEDAVFEIGLTPNRSDATSHIGVARDLVALINIHHHADSRLQYPSADHFPTDGKKPFITVNVEDTEACPRYTSACISNVTVKESPEWLKTKLTSIGVRPVNNVVDATQFVLFEMGQPLHAFDAKAITGNRVVVKKATEETPFVTLDGVERKLGTNDLMICNEKEPMCIAGVFGGEKSGVGLETKDIFLESAYFSPVGIRKTAKYHGLKTDASFRYERGCDPNITVYAIKRAALLIRELAGGEISAIDDFYPQKIEKQQVVLHYDYLNRLIGKKIEKETVKKILSAIEIEIIEEKDEEITLSIPANKVDVTREADVIEEFLRIYGYNNIEIDEKFCYSMSFLPQNPLIRIQETISDYLSNNGFFEAMNNSLTKEEYAAKFDFVDASQTVTLLNPLSRDLQNMRQTLLFDGLENIIHNINHGTSDIKLYEFGTVYQKNPEAQPSDDVTKRFLSMKRLAIFVSGKKQHESWQEKQSDVDFYYLKNMVVNAMERINLPLHTFSLEMQTTTASMNNVLQYLHNKEVFITIGAINDKLLKHFDIKQDVFYAEINCDMLTKLTQGKKVMFEDLNKFPEVNRDLALLTDKQITYKEIEDLAFKTERNYLKSVNLFDVYEGEHLEAGKKSYAIRFVLSNKEKTLTNDEINKIMDKLIAACEKNLGAKLR
ncbi:MAG: phenylalanine--tRNA ligase subunit beta [Bacteroidales bacterium]|jgi:phenylalanyl-tRNA synthetase beta chain|nr:phenylalanine--tRNA ligase subunit beta [Bacteroidales bacterium]